MISVVRVASPHDVIGNDGIDFDPGNLRAAIGYGAQHVHSATRSNDGKITTWAQHVDHGWRCAHQVVLPRRPSPSMRVHVHDRGAGVSIDDDVLRAVWITVDLYARDGIPADVFHSRGGVVPLSFRVAHAH